MKSLEQRFWEKVRKTASCWIWTAGQNGWGYAQFSAWGKSRIASRIVWWLTYGKMPPRRLYVCHKCDNRLCVRPSHLFLGTALRNNHDKMLKGRAAGPNGFLAPRIRKSKRGPEPRPLAERFWAKVKKTDECWLWIGAHERDGRGVIGLDPKGTRGRAPHISWQMHFGAVPKGLWVLHKCDNPACVRPDHLFLGTASDNNLDSVRKGRRRMPPVNGENNPRAILDESDVREIRQSQLSSAELAVRYGVSRGTIYHAKSGYTWGNVV